MLLMRPAKVTTCLSKEEIICQERIRQARLGFNLSLISTVASSTVTLAGIILLLSGQISPGGLATVGGFASNLVRICCLQLAKDANDRLDKVTELERRRRLRR
jgi:hypothetical protein